MSKAFLDKTHVDLPKKIKNLSHIYEMLSELNNEKKDDVEKEIYKIINTEIQNKDNKDSIIFLIPFPLFLLSPKRSSHTIHIGSI